MTFMTNKEIKENFARNLLFLLTENRVTVKQLSEGTGICSRNIDRYLAQESVIPVDKMVHIADYFNVSLDFLVERNKDLFDAEWSVIKKVLKLIKN